MTDSPSLQSLANLYQDADTIQSQDQILRQIIKHLLTIRTKALGSLPSTGKLGDQYPIDPDGFARSLDPIVEVELYQQYFQRYGFVVGKQVIPTNLSQQVINRINQVGQQLSHGQFDIRDISTNQSMPRDADGTPLFSRGFFELYHDAIWAEIRQSLRLYLHHATIWGSPFLWTSFDRFGVKPPGNPESKALPLHTDQSPAIDHNFKTIQGILALSACPVELGTTVMVPGSRTYFDQLRPFTQPNQQYVELADTHHPTIADFQAQAQPIPLRSGDLLTWDSRCVHANTANLTTDQTRYVALVATGLAHPDRADLVERRHTYFDLGLGQNDREAYMHASIRPRYTDPQAIQQIRQPEMLTSLGQCLYGFTDYEDFLAQDPA